MAEHTPTPWIYRPNKYDDWGYIRGPKDDYRALGPIAAIARGESPLSHDEHRIAGTDPYAANAALIIKAVNKYDETQDLLVDLWFHFSDTFDPVLSKLAARARNLIDGDVSGSSTEGGNG